MFRGLAIDLDGTLLLPDGQPSARSIATLTAASAAGLHVIIASARWAALAARVARQVPGSRIVVACSGAQVHDLTAGRDVLDIRLPTAFTLRAMEICNELSGVGTFALDEDVFVRLEKAREPNPASPEVQYVTHLEPRGDERARVIMVQRGEAPGVVRAEVDAHWADEIHMVDALSSTGRNILTLTAAGAHKGVALRAACAELGIDASEVVAFGDSGNDIELFRAAGASVAMANGTFEAKQAATIETVSNLEDGVAVVVERLLRTGRIEE